MKRKMFLKVKEKSLLDEIMFHFFKKNVVKAYLIQCPFKSDCDTYISGKHLNVPIKKDTPFHIFQNKQVMHRISPTSQVFLNYVFEFKNISETGSK